MARWLLVCRRVRALILASLLVVWQGVARADEAATDCPVGREVAAGGTWTTQLIESVEDCEADPACAKTGQGFLGLPATAPRAPHGSFLTLDGTLGAVGRASGHDADAAGLVGAHLTAGWWRGLQICARTRAELGIESRAVSAFGLTFPLAFWTVSLGGEQTWLARPSLSAPRIWLRRAYSSARTYVAAGVVVWREAAGGTSTIIPVTVTTEKRDQSAGATDPAVLEQVHVAAYEHVRGDARVEVLRFEIDSLYANGLPADLNAPLPAATMELVRFDPVVLRGAFAGHLHGELSAGYASASQSLVCTACAPLVGSLELGGPIGSGADAWTVRAERTAQLALDARITVEDRLSASFRHSHHHHTLRVDAYSAITRTTAAGDGHAVVTGGAAVGVDFALRHQLELSLAASAGRSYYARLDADPSPVAERAALAEVRLERHFSIH